MTAVHGSKASFRIGTVAIPATLVDASTLASSVGISFSRETADVTTFGSTSKKYISGMKDATISYEGPFDNGSTLDQQLWDIYDQGATVSFEYCPAGFGTTTTPKYTGTCFVTGYELSSDVTDAAKLSGELQIAGVVTRAIQ